MQELSGESLFRQPSPFKRTVKNDTIFSTGFTPSFLDFHERDEIQMTDESAQTTYEEQEIRCPRLGGQVTFSYCKVEAQGWPCARCLTCWEPYFDVEGVCRALLSPEKFEECFLKPPPSRMSTLLELIERAKKLTENDKSEE